MSLQLCDKTKKYINTIHKCFHSLDNEDAKLLVPEIENNEFNLITLTEPLILLSNLNQKYSHLSYDDQFFDKVTPTESIEFLTQLRRMTILLTKFFFHLQKEGETS